MTGEESQLEGEDCEASFSRVEGDTRGEVHFKEELSGRVRRFGRGLRAVMEWES